MLQARMKHPVMVYPEAMKIMQSLSEVTRQGLPEKLLELVHLKGTGRVLLQLDGNLRAMPIPVAAPLVVPLHRVVGWFGRVTPRLTGFGGRGAVELTGEGYALLGAPPERPERMSTDQEARRHARQEARAKKREEKARRKE